jgi:hypothetical protein
MSKHENTNPVKAIRNNDFTGAKETVNRILYTKAQVYMAARKLALAHNTMKTEVSNERETPSGQG